MGRYPKYHAEGKERKRRSFGNVVDHGFDEDLEDECRALKAEDELREYWVDRCLGERADARQAARQAAAPLASPPNQALPPPPANQGPAAPANQALPPPPANQGPAAPANQALAPPPANQGPAAPADGAPAAAN